MSEPTHSQLLERIAKLEAVVDSVKDDVREIKDDMKPLREAATMGRGALFAILKFGTVIVALAGGAAWLFERFHK